MFDIKKLSEHFQTIKDHRSTAHSNRPKSIEPSSPTLKMNHPSIHESFPNNPYRALLERLRQANSSKSLAHQMKTKEPHSSDLSSVRRSIQRSQPMRFFISLDRSSFSNENPDVSDISSIVGS